MDQVDFISVEITENGKTKHRFTFSRRVLSTSLNNVVNMVRRLLKEEIIKE